MTCSSCEGMPEEDSEARYPETSPGIFENSLQCCAQTELRWGQKPIESVESWIGAAGSASTAMESTASCSDQ
jgi:hypothetical protein